MGAVWSTPTQVVGQGLAHIPRQWESVQTRPLATNQDLAGMPVDVMEFQSGSLPGAHSESRQHRQDRKVPYANRRATVTTREKPRDVLGLQRPGQISAPPG